MTVRIGQLRHRLTIEQAVRTDDSGGGAAVSWDVVDEVWGHIEALSGKENFEADRISGEASFRIIIRHRSDLAPSMRFRHNAKIYEILALMDQDGRGRFLTCKCERRDL